MSLPTKIATATFLRRGDETLFIDYRNYPHQLHAGKYSVPGGHLERGESIGQCAIREVKQETEIIVRNPISRGMVLFINERRTFHGELAKYNFKVYFYDFFDFDDSNAKSKEGPLVWVPNKEVPSLELHEGDRAVWRWLQEHKNKYFNAKILHIGEKLTGAYLLD